MLSLSLELNHGGYVRLGEGRKHALDTQPLEVEHTELIALERRIAK